MSFQDQDYISMSVIIDWKIYWENAIIEWKKGMEEIKEVMKNLCDSLRKNLSTKYK